MSNRTPYDRILTTVKPRLAGVAIESLKQELFETLDEFFRNSDVWRDDIPFEIKAHQREGYIHPSIGQIVRLMFAYKQPPTGESRKPVSRDQIIPGATLPEPDKIRSQYVLVSAQRGIANVSLTVSDPTTREAMPVVPMNILDRYRPVIIDGLLSRMYSQPQKPFTNLALADYHARRFRGGTSRAKNEVQGGHLAGSQPWVFPASFTRV